MAPASDTSHLSKQKRASDPLRYASATPFQLRTPATNVRHSLPTPRTIQFTRVFKNTDARKSPQSPDLAQKFAEQLDEYRGRLYESTEQTVMEIEETRKHEIETLAARFTKRLTLLRNLTEPLATELADERIKSSTAGSTCGEGRSKEAEYRLGDRMAGFETTFTAREDRIKKLFTQWQRVQGRIIMLAVKIYGRDAVYLIPDQIYPNMEKHFAEAAKEHESLSEQQRKRSNGIDELEKGVLEMSKQTKEQVNAIHQLFKNEQKRRRAELERAQSAVDDLN